MLRALADPATYGASGAVDAHETHASWVFVVGERAYKVKKALVLPFLDYGTLERRRAACREEVRVNAELAPGIYLGVRAVVRRHGRFALADEDAAEALEYAVEMRRFDERDTLAGLIAAGVLRPEQVRAVARQLADFHAAAASVEGGRAGEVLAAWRTNLREFEPSFDSAEMETFAAAFVRSHAREIEARRKAGMIRDGHGDLRCEHVLVGAQLSIVDRIEFDPELRHTDVSCDLAFLAMDLEALGQSWAAAELVASYEQHGGDAGSRALLAFYEAHRALVRAKVALIAAGERVGAEAATQIAAARSLLRLARRLCWRARSPVVVLVCGPAASGKSTLAAELALRSGLTCLSSDAVRKSAAGVAATERAPEGAYSAAFTLLTYQALAREARRELDRCGGVIVDATCWSRAEREPIVGLLGDPAVTAVAVRCAVPLATALERAADRAALAARVSDATPEIAAEQHRRFDELDELDRGMVLRLDTRRPLEEQLATLTAAVDSRLGLDRDEDHPQAFASDRGGGQLEGCCR